MANDKHVWIVRGKLIVCKKCGIVRREDGQNGPCRGKIK